MTAGDRQGGESDHEASPNGTSDSDDLTALEHLDRILARRKSASSVDADGGIDESVGEPDSMSTGGDSSSIGKASVGASENQLMVSDVHKEGAQETASTSDDSAEQRRSRSRGTASYRGAAALVERIGARLARGSMHDVVDALLRGLIADGELTRSVISAMAERVGRDRVEALLEASGVQEARREEMASGGEGEGGRGASDVFLVAELLASGSEEEPDAWLVWLDEVMASGLVDDAVVRAMAEKRNLLVMEREMLGALRMAAESARDAYERALASYNASRSRARRATAYRILTALRSTALDREQMGAFYRFVEVARDMGRLDEFVALVRAHGSSMAGRAAFITAFVSALESLQSINGGDPSMRGNDEECP